MRNVCNSVAIQPSMLRVVGRTSPRSWRKKSGSGLLRRSMYMRGWVNVPGERAPEARQREGVRLRRVETNFKEINKGTVQTLTAELTTNPVGHYLPSIEQYMWVSHNRLGWGLKYGGICTRMRTPPHAVAMGTGEQHTAISLRMRSTEDL